MWNPRVGGEKSLQTQRLLHQQGSPPRGRGKGAPARSRWPPAGITPAWAGKSMPWLRPGAAHGDHPRMGGEKVRLRWKPKSKKGSPPRGRGKVSDGEIAKGKVRITPAWAGKSSQTEIRHSSREDHPRMGGEKGLRVQYAAGLPGSPPRRRGKDDTLHISGFFPGITPAQAGKRWRCIPCFCIRWDHPRAGGEKCCLRSVQCFQRGSPPRGRGKVLVVGIVLHRAGITPAWAGKARHLSHGLLPCG